jgi:hypothetical protein
MRDTTKPAELYQHTEQVHRMERNGSARKQAEGVAPFGLS